MLNPRLLVVLALVVAGAPRLSAQAPAAASPPELIGILPFDAVTSEGYSATASRGLANMLRAEMVRDPRLMPKLLDLPRGTRPPLAPAESARLGRAAKVDLVLAGTVIGTDVDRKRVGGSTGGVLRGVGLGGRVGRTQATVNLQVQLINPADGAIIDTFEVEAKSSSFSGGSNVWTEIGRMNFDDDDWVRTPIGKALHEAALEIIGKVVARERQEVRP